MKNRVVEAIEPTQKQVPRMDRPSVALSWFLDAMQIEEDYSYDSQTPTPTLVCQVCRESICDVEFGDTLRVLLNTALAHGCRG